MFLWVLTAELIWWCETLWIHVAKGQDELPQCDLNCCLRIQHIAGLWDTTRSRLAGLTNPSGFLLRHGHIVRMAIKGEEPVISDNYHKSACLVNWHFERWVTFEEAVTHHCHTCMLSNMTSHVAEHVTLSFQPSFDN